MEGSTLLRKLREVLSETSTSSFLNDRTSYDNLYDAVGDFNFKTHYLTATQTINVTASTSSYNLNPDFVSLALMDDYNRPFIQWTYNGSTTAIYGRDYRSIVLENSTATDTVAQSFSIVDADQPSNITGTATGIGTSSNGESNLIDAAANFSTVAVGDFVHNTTQSTDGVVIAGTSSTQLVTAMFTDGVKDASWSVSDAYVIVPQPRYQIVFSPTPSDTATVTIKYVKRPDPVYSLFRAYKLPFNYMLPIVQFAAFLYKYRDREPNYGDAFFKYYDGFTRKIAAEMRRATGERQGMRVNFSKINARSRSIGNWSR